MIAWVATYRLQLRGGVDLDAARGRLEAIKALGASHLYLSPPFTAAPGSSHGYDVTDPTRIDPALGGEDAFARLAEAARAAGMGLVIDIVPNHMAFTPESPWLADVLRFGRTSEFAHVFDIDWERGPIHFPALDGTVRSVFAQGHIAMAGTGEDPQLAVYERRFPLALTRLQGRWRAASVRSMARASTRSWRSSTGRSATGAKARKPSSIAASSTSPTSSACGRSTRRSSRAVTRW